MHLVRPSRERLKTGSSADVFQCFNDGVPPKPYGVRKYEGRTYGNLTAWTPHRYTTHFGRHEVLVQAVLFSYAEPIGVRFTRTDGAGSWMVIFDVPATSRTTMRHIAELYRALPQCVRSTTVRLPGRAWDYPSLIMERLAAITRSMLGKTLQARERTRYWWSEYNAGLELMAEFAEMVDEPNPFELEPPHVSAGDKVAAKLVALRLRGIVQIPAPSAA